MIEKKIIEAKEDTPEIILDYENKTIKISGYSFPDNAIDIYKPIIDWISENLNKLDSLTIEINFKILSSASNKQIYEIMYLLEDYYKKGKDIKVKWYYNKEDDDMEYEGNSFKQTFDIPIELISI